MNWRHQLTWQDFFVLVLVLLKIFHVFFSRKVAVFVIYYVFQFEV